MTRKYGELTKRHQKACEILRDGEWHFLGPLVKGLKHALQPLGYSIEGKTENGVRLHRVTIYRMPGR